MPLKPRVRRRRRPWSEKSSNRPSPALVALLEERDAIAQLLVRRAPFLAPANVRALKAKLAAIGRAIQRIERPRDPLTCVQPDRDVPALLCGYPLPCPYHTAILEPDGAVRIPPALRDRAVRRIRQVGLALQLALEVKE